MKYIVLLDGLSIFRVLGLAACRREIYLLDEASGVPGIRQLVRWTARLLIAARRMHHVSALGPIAEMADRQRGMSLAVDWYRPAEQVMLSQLCPETTRSLGTEYDFAAAKQTVKHGFFYLGVVTFVEKISGKNATSALTVVGGAPVLEGIYRAAKQVPGGIEFRPSRPWNRGVNLFLAIFTVLYAIAEVCRLVRIGVSHRLEKTMAFDMLDNPDRMLLQITNTLENPETDALLVFRNKADAAKMHSHFPRFSRAAFGDGCYSPVQTIAGIARSVWDGIGIYGRYGHLSPALFVQIAKLNVIRLRYRALFNKYKLGNFWGRDEYNAEHVIRSQELRRRGAVSIGLINGINVFGWDVVYRFIDYDRTYVFSPGPFLKYNSENWRVPTGVRQIGAVAMDRKALRSMAGTEKTMDIVCFAKGYCDGADFLDQLRKIAEAFPERNVLVSLKKSAARLGGVEEFVDGLKDAPANLKMVDDPSFDLIAKCRYVLSGESSIISEAINLGSIAFFLDTYAKDEIYIYRDYPDLSYRDGDRIVERIRSIENGSWRYPVEQFADLADLSGWVSFDVIRRDIGLDPLDPPILADFWANRPTAAA
jgi:hypothetical protein